MKYKCIIFDCDGVLVDSEAISNQVIVDLANTNGAAIDLAYAIKYFAGTSLSYVRKSIEQIIQKPLPDSFEKEYRFRSFEKFRSEIRPVKGIPELLDRLQIPFCVASNGPTNKIILNLELTGLLHHFSGKIFSAYEIDQWKPDPLLFITAAKTMGFEPQDCLVVEDSLSGVKAAIAGGFDVYALCTEQKEMVFSSLGAKTVRSIEELQEILFA